MELIKDDLDTSDYPKEHSLYSTKNKKVTGKFKDVLAGRIMSESVFLRSKAYSFLVENKDIEKLKGITKNYQ